MSVVDVKERSARAGAPYLCCARALSEVVFSLNDSCMTRHYGSVHVEFGAFRRDLQPSPKGFTLLIRTPESTLYGSEVFSIRLESPEF